MGCLAKTYVFFDGFLMARYDVFRNPNPRSRIHNPYLLDVQADALAGLKSRVVVPFSPAEEAPKMPRSLYPLFEIEGCAMVMLTPLVAGVPLASLGEHVGTLEEEGVTILAALDLLLTGA